MTLSLCLAAASGVSTLSGCRVTENDVHRWETTEFGPLKLGAVVKHDKYPMPLRLEAAMGLIRMKPRAGRRVGIEKLTDSLREMQPDDRKKVVNGLVPMIIAQMDKPLPVAQGMSPQEGKGPDPSVPFKDTAYALLNNDKANLVTDEASRKALQEALVRWATADFDRRITITSQLYGLEQIFRTGGADAVRTLPPLIKPDSTYDRISSLVAELGDQPTKDATAKKLVELAQYTESPAWVAKVKPLIDEANKKGGYQVAEDKLNKQVSEYQDEQVIKVYASMKKVGGRAVVDYLLGVAQDEARPVKRRQAAMAAVEGRLDRNSASDAAAVMKIAGAEKTPDDVRELAFGRASELSREQVIDKLYALFDTSKATDPKRWKVRWVAASTVLKMSQAKDVPLFLSKLPPNPAAGFAMGEALEYGNGMGKMKPPPANEQMVAELKSPILANKLTALGFFYQTGKTAELPAVHALAEDRTPLPKVEEADAKWQWQVPKAGGTPGQTETKELTTIGEFVQLVVEPAMKARK